jgi:hypothetical protein
VHDAVCDQANPDDDVEPSALVDLPAAPARGLEDLLASRVSVTGADSSSSLTAPPSRLTERQYGEPS